MQSTDWSSTPTNWDGNYPTSNVRIISDFDRHADEAMALANQPGIALADAIRRHPAGKAL